MIKDILEEIKNTKNQQSLEEVAKPKDKDIEQIAFKHFPNVETLKTRNRDSLDFYDVAVWAIKNSLTDAYNLGFKEGQKNKKA